MNTNRLFRLLLAMIIIVLSGIPSQGNPTREGSGEEGPGDTGSVAAYEMNPVFEAAELWDAEVLVGPQHRVRNEVRAGDYMHHYVIDSDWGVFEVEGDALLLIRIQEFQALKQLQDVSKTDAFQSALVAAAKSPFVAAKDIVMRPVATVKGLPGGITRYFTGMYHGTRKDFHEAGEVVDDVLASEKKGEPEPATEEAAEGSESPGALKTGIDETEKYSKRYMGYNAARRKLAKRLAVDPYSSNPKLQAELDRLAWAAFAGGFAAKSMPRVPGLSEASKVNQQVWSLSPDQLERQNGKKLEAMGVDEKLRWQLFYNRQYSMSVQTELVNALHRLKDIEGRPDFVQLAVQADSESAARLFARMAGILARYHTDVATLERVSTLGGRASALTTQGALVVPIAVDVIPWTEIVDKASSHLEYQNDHRELALSGRLTERASRELEDRGWAVREVSP